MANQNTELKIDLFEELSDEQLAIVTGGVEVNTFIDGSGIEAVSIPRDFNLKLVNLPPLPNDIELPV